ncbi:MAG TPA: isoprenylcysteine carboxylmethyltransferase family protein [Candidatus Acidoferrales bacterium]|nr:isoprenylcysteine carboxylmethyltransferase family protein [Candidatus Acidoferrales bacterium]
MVISVGALLRVFTIILFIAWWFYWTITEREADREKPKTVTIPVSGLFLRRWFTLIIEVVLLLQLLGLQILPLSGDPFLVQVIGFAIVVAGVSISFSARNTLGTNWTHAYEYQVKKGHSLVTSGIYAYIRHPIYTGLYLALIGGELVAQSYVALLFLLLFIGGHWQARQEETLLLKYFGSSYKSYMKRTKMFIPFLW